MMSNALTSLFYSIIMPIIINFFSNRSVKFDSDYIIKIIIVFTLSMTTGKNHEE